MEVLTNSPVFWKETSIVVAGVAAALSIFWEVKDKRTKKITGWGRIFLGITMISMLGALFAQVLESKEADARNKKAQDETLQLLTRTHQSIVELARLLQPLEHPEVTIFLDLQCGPPAYRAFCSSAQTQANRALAAFEKKLSQLPVVLRTDSPLRAGTSFSGDKKFDWRKYPGAGPFSYMHLHLFKTIEKFEEYANGHCLNCAEAGDLTLIVLATSKNLSPSYKIKRDGVWVDFLATFKEIKPSIRSTAIMSMPDLEGAVIAVYDPYFFDVLKPTTIFIDTPRGQRATGEFQTRDVKGARLYFAEFPKK